MKLKDRSEKTGEATLSSLSMWNEWQQILKSSTPDAKTANGIVLAATSPPAFELKPRQRHSYIGSQKSSVNAHHTESALSIDFANNRRSSVRTESSQPFLKSEK